MQNQGKSVFDLDANLVALLCYLGNLVCALGLILSIITVITDKNNRLARFHAWQSILTSVAGLIIGIPLYFLLFAFLFMNSTITTLLAALIGLFLTLFGIALFVLTILAAIKGYGGQMYKIPVIGNFAEKYA